MHCPPERPWWIQWLQYNHHHDAEVQSHGDLLGSPKALCQHNICKRRVKTELNLFQSSHDYHWGLIYSSIRCLFHTRTAFYSWFTPPNKKENEFITSKYQFMKMGQNFTTKASHGAQLSPNSLFINMSHSVIHKCLLSITYRELSIGGFRTSFWRETYTCQ